MTDLAPVEAPPWFVREYSGGPDYHMVKSWWDHHNPGNGNPFRESLLPPQGWIVEKDGEPIGAGWLYLSLGIGVAFLDNVVTRPGLTPETSTTALGHVLGIAKEFCRLNDYGAIVCHTVPAIARYASRFGRQTRDHLVQITFPVE